MIRSASNQYRAMPAFPYRFMNFAGDTYAHDVEAGFGAAVMPCVQDTVVSGTGFKAPNELLRRARQRFVSPSGSGRPMSRVELAALVKSHLTRCGVKHHAVDAGYVGKLERGDHRWPQRCYREAFRAVLGVASDAELGFFVIRRERHIPVTVESPGAVIVPTMEERRARTMWLALSADQLSAALDSCALEALASADAARAELKSVVRQRVGHGMTQSHLARSAGQTRTGYTREVIHMRDDYHPATPI